jgi:hypothetical protein
MSRRARRNHTPAFKAKVALAARADVAKALVWRRWTASINDTTEELFSTTAL